MRIHHLSCGTMCPVGGTLMLYRRSRDPALRRLVCQCLLVETDRHGDTGFGLRDVHQPRQRLAGFFRTLNGIRLREEETAQRQIERLGFRAADVRHIVLTHLDSITRAESRTSRARRFTSWATSCAPRPKAGAASSPSAAPGPI